MGLRLLLNVEKYEYMRGFRGGAGVQIIVHPPGEAPQVGTAGIALAPGSHSYIAIDMLKVSKQGIEFVSKPHPY